MAGDGLFNALQECDVDNYKEFTESIGEEEAWAGVGLELGGLSRYLVCSAYVNSRAWLYTEAPPHPPTRTH